MAGLNIEVKSRRQQSPIKGGAQTHLFSTRPLRLVTTVPGFRFFFFARVILFLPDGGTFIFFQHEFRVPIVPRPALSVLECVLFKLYLSTLVRVAALPVHGVTRSARQVPRLLITRADQETSLSLGPSKNCSRHAERRVYKSIRGTTLSQTPPRALRPRGNRRRTAII